MDWIGSGHGKRTKGKLCKRRMSQWQKQKALMTYEWFSSNKNDCLISENGSLCRLKNWTKHLSGFASRTTSILLTILIGNNNLFKSFPHRKGWPPRQQYWNKYLCIYWHFAADVKDSKMIEEDKCTQDCWQFDNVRQIIRLKLISFQILYCWLSEDRRLQQNVCPISYSRIWFY